MLLKRPGCCLPLDRGSCCLPYVVCPCRARKINHRSESSGKGRWQCPAATRREDTGTPGSSQTRVLQPYSPRHSLLMPPNRLDQRMCQVSRKKGNAGIPSHADASFQDRPQAAGDTSALDLLQAPACHTTGQKPQPASKTEARTSVISLPGKNTLRVRPQQSSRTGDLFRPQPASVQKTKGKRTARTGTSFQKAVGRHEAAAG